MQTVTYSHARENLKSVMDQAVKSRAPIKIFRQRDEGVVVISESEWASMEETLYLLSSPANAQHLLDGMKELDAGQGTLKTLDDLINP
jgi:antitoxin YefM